MDHFRLDGGLERLGLLSSEAPTDRGVCREDCWPPSPVGGVEPASEPASDCLLVVDRPSSPSKGGLGAAQAVASNLL